MSELDYLVQQYLERMEYLKEGLARGNISTYEDYKFVCGQLRGLEAACGVIEDLKQRKETQDNE